MPSIRCAFFSRHGKVFFLMFQNALPRHSTSRIETSSSATSLTMVVTGKSLRSRAATAADDFRSVFPGLASRSSGRNIQTYLPTGRKGARQHNNG